MKGTWFRGYEKDTWRDLESNGGKEKDFEKQAAEPEQIGYYDAGRKLIVCQRHYDTHHYDPKKNEWAKVLVGSKDDGKTPYGHDARSVMYHDPLSGHGLLVHFETSSVWSYDPDARKWTKQTFEGDPMPTGGKRLAYFDPAHNALVVIDGVTVWAYRYK
jgi:N-acetylneuraminic acid mutarotase